MPLNPVLYNAMVAVFGHDRIRIVHEGQSLHGSYYADTNGRQRFRSVNAGEYYVTNCPYCNDLKKRLWINHAWGVEDPKTGDPRYWLAHCFNEDCLHKGDHLDDLKERLLDYQINAASGRIQLPPPQVVSGSLLRRIQLPKDFVLLSDLKRGHPARRYLRSRQFDPDQLAREWGVGFSREAFCLSPQGRLLIPLRAHLPEHGWCDVGWQARSIDPNEELRYFTRSGTRKNAILYGLDHVTEDHQPVLIVEGITDVWRAGSNTVAIFGHHLSDEQLKLLRQRLGDRPLVLMLDPDVADDVIEEAAVKIRAALGRSLRGRHPESRVVIAALPDERDPGDCSRKEIWAAARKALNRGKKHSKK